MTANERLYAQAQRNRSRRKLDSARATILNLRDHKDSKLYKKALERWTKHSKILNGNHDELEEPADRGARATIYYIHRKKTA